MRQLGNMNFLVLFSILFLINESSCLKCWRCSSDSTSSKYCGATIDFNQITEQQRKWNYVEYGPKPDTVENIENLISKCRVLLQLVNGLETYTRSCYWEPDNVPANSCVVQKYNPSFVKTVACSTCVGDGCNDKLINGSEVKDITNENRNNSPPDSMIAAIPTTAAADSKNTAVLSVLSHTVLVVMLMLGVVIGY